MKNCIRLKTRRPFSDTYAYLDTTEYYADQIFINNKLRVKFLKDYSHNEDSYIIIMVRVPKRKTKIFLKCMNELNNKMLILGYNDYNSLSIIERVIVHNKEKKEREKNNGVKEQRNDVTGSN